MTHPIRFIFKLAMSLMVGLALFSNSVLAQTPQAKPPQVANNPNVPPITGDGNIPVQNNVLPKELEQILQAWEKRTAQIERMKGDFRRYEYDSVFAVEKRTIGQFWFESPDKARMDFKPDPELPNPPLNDVNGKKFAVQGDDPKSWICNGKEILDIDLANKSYNRVQIPVAYQGKNITNGPLPFLFGMKAEDMKARYRLALGEKHDVAGGILHIVAYPLVPALRREFSRAELLLSVQTFLPIAIKLWDPAENKETVYMFFNHKTNSFQMPFPDPFNPKLIGYKLVHDQKAPAGDGTSNGINPEARENSGIMIR